MKEHSCIELIESFPKILISSKMDFEHGRYQVMKFGQNKYKMVKSFSWGTTRRVPCGLHDVDMEHSHKSMWQVAYDMESWQCWIGNQVGNYMYLSPFDVWWTVWLKVTSYIIWVRRLKASTILFSFPLISFISKWYSLRKANHLDFLAFRSHFSNKYFRLILSVFRRNFLPMR